MRSNSEVLSLSELPLLGKSDTPILLLAGNTAVPPSSDRLRYFRAIRQNPENTTGTGLSVMGGYLSSPVSLNSPLIAVDRGPGNLCMPAYLQPQHDSWGNLLLAVLPFVPGYTAPEIGKSPSKCGPSICQQLHESVIRKFRRSHSRNDLPLPKRP